jgi:hypothetical protein
MSTKESSDNLVKVYSVQGQLRGAVIKSALESAGIPVMLKFESIGATLGLTVDGLGRVDILVPAQWEQEAIDLLNASCDDTPEE